MIEYVLQITLQSPLTSAAGEGRVGIADRDVAFDDLGLPILPGRRLKGLWREAYRDVFDAWKLCGESLIPAEDIFGKSGQVPSTRDVRLHVANAKLEEASSLRRWLYYLQDPKAPKLSLEDVVQHYTNVRAQTAIDRHTGAAGENTLRLTRTLRPGLVFRAQVSFVTAPDNVVINALALGAAALQYMGTGRTRGLGKVYCQLIALHLNDPEDQECDLTEQALKNQDLLPSITVGNPVELSQKSEDENIETVNETEEVDSSAKLLQTSEDQATDVFCSNCATPTYMLRYRLTLREPAVIPVADGDPNTVVTRQDIPGSHLWGAAAWHYLHQPNYTPADKAFRHAFLDGGLRFLTAYPEADPKAFNEEKQRLIPIPHSIRKSKKDETLVDFVEKPPEILNDEQTKRHDRQYCRINSGRLETQVVKTERNYHHARAKDRRKGRALGAEVPDGGTFFTYEAIETEQSFQGAVLGSEDDLKSLQRWLQGVNTMSVGRSRSAQYGEAEFEWLDKEPLELENRVEWNGFAARQTSVAQIDLGEEWDEEDDWAEGEEWGEDGSNGFVEQQTSDGSDLGKHLVITTLSPLLTVNAHGHPEARFPEHELETVLGLGTSAKKLTLSRSYTRTELVGGYNAHLRLPRQQWIAIAAGSVFVFDAEDLQGCINEDNLLKLEHDGLGLRKGEGYGRIAVNRLKLDLTKEETRLDDPKDYRAQPREESPQKVQELLQGITRTQCLAEMQQRAMAAAAENKVRNIPSNSLLGKLRLFLRLDPAAAVESLKNLPEPTKDKLRQCQIDTTEGDTLWLSNDSTLYKLFEVAWTKPESLTSNGEEHKEGFWPRLLEIVKNRDHTDMDGTKIGKLVDEMCKVFLDHLLTALHRKARR